MKEALDILNQIEGIRAETLRRFGPLTQAQLDWRPEAKEGEAAWSLGEVFFHIAADEDYLREHIARPLLEGVHPPEAIHFIPPPPPYGAKKEVIQFWFDRARVLTRRILENFPDDANLTLKHVGGLQPMNGLEWFMGYGGHEAYHHQQIDALLKEMPQ